MIFFSALLWGGEYVVVKDMLDYLPPNWINAFRFITASLIMIPLFYRHIRSMSKEELRGGAILGTFMFGGFTLQTVGIQYTTAAKSGFLTSTYVVMVPFIVWVFKQKFPGLKSLISAGVLIAGISFLSLDGTGKGLNRGDMLTLGAAICFAGSIIGFDYYAKRHDPINLTFIEMLSGGLMSLVSASLTEAFPSPAGYGAYEIFQLLYLVLLGSLLCHVLSNVAMKWAEPTHASILWSLESVFALIFGLIFLHEDLTLRMGIGFILVFAAVLLTELGGKIRQKENSV